MKNIDILFRVDGVINFSRINVFRPRFLDEDAMNFGVFIQFIDDGQ